MANLTLNVLPEELAVCQGPAGSRLPEEILRQPFWSATVTADELSLVIPEKAAPQGWKVERGWRALQVPGPLDFAVVGVIANLAAPLAAAEISIFALSTFNTDYILLKRPTWSELSMFCSRPVMWWCKGYKKPVDVNDCPEIIASTKEIDRFTALRRRGNPLRRSLFHR